MPALPYSPANLAITVIALASAVVLCWARYGRPHNRLAFISVSGPMLVLCVGWALMYGGGDVASRWARLKPEVVLLRDVHHGNANVRRAAVIEARRRVTAGTLSPDRQRALIDGVLDAQADPNRPWDPGLGGIVEAAQAAGKVTPQQWQRYQLQSVTFRLVPTFNRELGSPIPLLDLTVRRGPDRAGPAPTFRAELAVLVDDQMTVDGRRVATQARPVDQHAQGNRVDDPPKGLTATEVLSVPVTSGGVGEGGPVARIGGANQPYLTALAATPGAEQTARVTVVVRQARLRFIHEWIGERYVLLPGELRVPLEARWTLRPAETTGPPRAEEKPVLERQLREVLRRPGAPR